MAHRHYETEGLIIGSRNLGEANRLYQILTADFGLIKVLAQGVRHDRSKLRYHLENYSFNRFFLVRGREFWRLVGVEGLNLSIQRKESLVFFKKISLVLQRLIQGEDPRLLIYRDLKQAYLLLKSPDVDFNREDILNLEVFILARLLTRLGYFAWPLDFEDFSWAEIRNLKDQKLLLIKQINQALEATQL
jgi:DNA repair protein RecO (recombination protein O)